MLRRRVLQAVLFPLPFVAILFLVAVCVYNDMQVAPVKDSTFNDVIPQTERNSRSILMVVAHADDEALWAGDFLHHHGTSTHVIVTAGRSDISSIRKEEFRAVQDRLQFQGEYWLGRDEFRKDMVVESWIRERIRERVCEQAWEQIITHGAEGEYGHPIHQQVHDSVVDAVRYCCRNADKLFVFYPFPMGSEPESQPFSTEKKKILDLYASQRHVLYHMFENWNERIVPLFEYDFKQANRICQFKNLRGPHGDNFCRLQNVWKSNRPHQMANDYRLLYSMGRNVTFHARGVGC